MKILGFGGPNPILGEDIKEKFEGEASADQAAAMVEKAKQKIIELLQTEEFEAITFFGMKKGSMASKVATTECLLVGPKAFQKVVCLHLAQSVCDNRDDEEDISLSPFDIN